MPSGHTDRKTINERRPTTDLMKGILERIKRGEVRWGDLSTGEKNAARALIDRGLVHCPGTTTRYTRLSAVTRKP